MICKKKKHKYKTAPKKDRTCDNIVFDSKKEMERYKCLKWQKEKGLIVDFELQPKFELIMKVKYYADFKIINTCGHVHYEDVKGFETEEFKRKYRETKKQNPGIDLRIIKDV